MVEARDGLSRLKEKKVGQGKGVCGEVSRETRSPVINTGDHRWLAWPEKNPREKPSELTEGAKGRAGQGRMWRGE